MGPITPRQFAVDDDVVEAIAVDVARGGHRAPELGVEHLTSDQESVVGADIEQVDRRGGVIGAEHHGSGAGLTALAFPVVIADQQVVLAVAVHVARERHREAGVLVR